MQFTDTHTHLYLEEFDHDRDEMINRAINARVTQMFLPNIDSRTVDAMLKLSAQFPENCFPMMGLHPTSVKAGYREELEKVEALLENPPVKFYAVGEMGVDLYWDKTFYKEQVEVFTRQLELSMRHNLPVVIHTRNSMDIVLDIIEKMSNPALFGIFHCFGGNKAQAVRASGLGFKLGIGGVITYKNSGLQSVVEETDLEHLVLETDSPFLTPAPDRGKRNESSYIPVIAQKIAEIKKISLDEVAEITTKTAIELFKPQTCLPAGRGAETQRK